MIYMFLVVVVAGWVGVVVVGKKTVGISWGRYTSDKSQQLDLSE
jgi:hypothetical protein